MAIAVGPDGNPVLAGIAPGAEPWTYDLIVVKLSASDGSRMFESVPGSDRFFGGDALDLVLDNAGNPAVLFAYVAGGSPPTMRVAKFAAADGSRLWSSDLPALAGDRPENATLAADATGDFAAAASILGGTGERRVVAGRLAAADGRIAWSRIFPGAWSVAGPAVSEGHEALIALVEPTPGGTETQVRFARLAAADGSTTCETATALGAYGGSAFAYDGTSFVVAGASRASANQYFSTRVIKFGASACTLAWSVERRFAPLPGDQILLATALDAAGDVLVAGEPRGITAKLAAAGGALLWSAFESENLLPGAPYEAAAILAGADGDPFWVGTSSVFGWSSQPFGVRTMRLAGSTGAVTWTRAVPPQPGPTATSAYEGIPRWYPYSKMRALAHGSDGPVYVGGRYFDGARELPFVVALDPISGARAWSIFDPSNTASGGGGTEVIAAGGGGDAFVARAGEGLSRRGAATGAELWRSGGTSALAVPPDGDLRSLTEGLLPPPVPGLPPIRAVRTERLAAANGATIWSDTWGMSVDSGLVDIAASSNGTSFSLTAPLFAADRDGQVLAYAADGTRLWVATYTAGLAGKSDDPFAIAAGPDGDPVVAGRTDTGTNWNCLVQKFAAGSGALRWSRNYDRGYGGHDECYALAVTPEGDVVAVGMAHAPTGEYGLLTLKLSGADGSVLWSVLEPGVVVVASANHAVAIDPVGQVVVAGYKNNGAAWDLAVRRYAAATGAEFWRVDRASAAWSDSPACGAGRPGRRRLPRLPDPGPQPPGRGDRAEAGHASGQHHDPDQHGGNGAVRAAAGFHRRDQRRHAGRDGDDPRRRDAAAGMRRPAADSRRRRSRGRELHAAAAADRHPRAGRGLRWRPRQRPVVRHLDADDRRHALRGLCGRRSGKPVLRQRRVDREPRHHLRLRTRPVLSTSAGSCALRWRHS